jgi:uncharacterized phiE125 gp8 family phage protein
MKLSCIVEPTATPITLEEAKSFCRILSDDEDATLGILIGAATDYVQNATGRQLCEATFQILSHGVSPIILPKAPLKELISVEYLDGTGVWTALNEPDYALAWDIDVGAISVTVTSEVRITYKAGYTTIPNALKAWMLNRVSTLFENREGIVLGNLAELPKSVIDVVLDQYKVRYL